MKKLLKFIKNIFFGPPLSIPEKAELDHKVIMSQLDTVRTLEDIVFIKKLIKLFEKHYENETDVIDYYEYHTNQKLKYYRVVRSFSRLHKSQ